MVNHITISMANCPTCLSCVFDQPSTEGYIAVILPKIEESKTVTNGLLSREEYESVVSKRTRSTQPEPQPC